MQKVYLDNAATTPIAKEVVDAMLPYFTTYFGNPSSTHSYGREAKSAIEGARRSIAKNVGCKPSEIIFTSCGTEADNFAIRQSVQSLGVKRIVTSKIEHHAVLYTVEDVKKEGVEIVFLPLLDNGEVDIETLEGLLKKDVKTLVTLMHANNEIGTLTDIEKVGSLCNSYGAYFHSDMVQTIGHLPINFEELNIHFAASSAHKYHGPKGVGFLYRKSNLMVSPMFTGGAQERELRAGTENVALIIGMAKALEIACQSLKEDQSQIESLRNYLVNQLKESYPGVVLNTDINNSLYTVLNVQFPDFKNKEMILFSLDLSGVAVSGGSACASGSVGGSHVMDALEVPEDKTNIRFSFSRYNTKEEIDLVMDKLKELIVY